MIVSNGIYGSMDMKKSVNRNNGDADNGLSGRDMKSAGISDKGYVSYAADTRRSYGGDQSWFKELPEKLGGKWLSTIGCGLVASCDMIFYMQRSHGMTSLTELPPDGMDKQAFSRFAHRYIHSYIYKRYRRLNGLGGIAPKALCRGLNKYFSEKGYASYKYRFRSFMSYALSGDEGKQRFINDVYHMLESDIPVIVRIGTGYVKRSPAPRKKTFHWHYVTVTEMYADEGSGNIMLKCSSWGNEYTMALDDLFRHAGLTGGAVIVEQ